MGEEEELKKRYVGRWRKEKIFNGGIEKKWVDEEKKKEKKSPLSGIRVSSCLKIKITSVL